MIRFVTYKNFALLDAQIQDAYRRRCAGSGVAVLADIDDVAIIGPLRETRRPSKRSRDWLRRLAREIDALSTPERVARRRPSSRLIAANASHIPATDKSRHRRAGR